MSAIDDLPPLREVIREHALSARKSLGQNFLLDLNLTARIARAAGPLEDATVIEIGPGPGGLTRALLALGARRVIAVERDQRALPALEEISKRYPGRLEIICADAQHFDPRPLLGGASAQNRRQPALQHRHRASDRLAVDRAVAALVRHDGADVSARGGRAHRRARERRSLWPARRARELARRNKDLVRHFCQQPSCRSPKSPRRWCDWCPASPRSRATAGRSSRLRRRRSASDGKCCGKASNHWRSIRPGWRRRPMSIRRGAPKPFRSAALLPWLAN